MNITVYCGSLPGSDPAYVEAAKELGAWIGENGHTLVYGAGGEGLMGAVADATLEHDGKVIGIIPRFMVEKEWLRHGLTETHVVETMGERKAMLIEKSEAFIALPGGVGTLEEISEIICRVHLELTDAPCILFDQEGFYRPLYDMLQRMVDRELYEAEHFEALHFARSVEEIESILDTPWR